MSCRLLRYSRGVVIVVLAWGTAPVALLEAEQSRVDLEAGRAAYQQHCARCHGASGAGDGLDAKRFYPRPRDLTLGVYKFRSTVSGTPPTDEDLFRTITEGLPGTNMPDWKHLNEATRWQLVGYLKSLSKTFADTPPSPVAVEPDPGPARADVAKGRALYEQLGCAACHGASGRANGTSAAGLVDDWGLPIRTADLTQGWTYRGGQKPRDILLRLLTGIDGAGMPSYAEAISPADAWQLAYYVASLQEPPNWNLIAHALVVDGELPTTADDLRWAQAERTDVRLRNIVTPEGEWAHPPTVKAVRLQAIANGESVAFRFSWHDPSHGAGNPPDRLVLLLKPAGSEGDVVTLQAWPYAGAPTLDLCAWSEETGQVFEALATDFDSVINQVERDISKAKPLKPVLQHVSAYEDGRWQLIVQRALQPSEPAGAAAIDPSRFTALALAVWDGGNPQARAVSPWVDLSIRNSRDASIFRSRSD